MTGVTYIIKVCLYTACLSFIVFSKDCQQIEHTMLLACMLSAVHRADGPYMTI